jgi:hypothetical protein
MEDWQYWEDLFKQHPAEALGDSSGEDALLSLGLTVSLIVDLAPDPPSVGEAPSEESVTTDNTSEPVDSFPDAAADISADLPEVVEPAKPLGKGKLPPMISKLLISLQSERVLTINQMQEISGADKKRVYDLVHGLEWSGVIAHDLALGAYCYTGVFGLDSLDLAHLGEDVDDLREHKKRKEAEIEELRRRLIDARRAPSGSTQVSRTQ